MAQVILLNDLITKRGSARYLAPYLLSTHLTQHGFDTVVIDWFTAKENFFDFLKQFLGPETLMVGLSSTFLQPPRTTEEHFQTEQMYWEGFLWKENVGEFRESPTELRTLLDEYNPKAKIVIGGAKAMFGLDHADESGGAYQFVDYFILGTADRAIVKFCQQLHSGQTPPYIVNRGARIYANRDDLVGNTCPKTRFEPYHALQFGESLPIEISRGCIYNCKFCRYDKMESIRKPINELQEEMTRNYETFGTSMYIFSDDCFNDSRGKVETVCEMFLKLPFKVEWISHVRVDVACRFPETLDLMVESGARALHWGIESFSAKAARAAGKGTPPELVKEMLLNMKLKYGHRCLNEGSFITGLPHESRESLDETLDWVLTHEALDTAVFFPLGLYPYHAGLDGTVLDYDEYSRNPEKYGFRKVSFDPVYWEHDWMNSNEATAIADKMTRAWQHAGRRGYAIHIWDYPHLRTLGLTHDEIVRLFKDPQYGAEMTDVINTRRTQFVENYHLRLQQLWANKKTQTSASYSP